MTLYMPPHFRVDDRAALERFMDENGFATLVSHGAGGLSVRICATARPTVPNPSSATRAGCVLIVRIPYGPARRRLGSSLCAALFP